VINTDFSVVLLPTLACNAACDYCFEQHRGGTLDHASLEMIVDQLVELARNQDLKRMSVFWQGGEVTLLSPEWFEQAGEIFTKYLSQADVEIVHYLQTNLIGYDRSWNPLVYQMFGGSLGTSLDYPNLYRRPVGRQPEDFLPRWRQGYDAAREGGVHVGVIAVVNHATISTGAEAFYRFFVDELGIDDFQVNTPFFARNQANSLEPLDPTRSVHFSSSWRMCGLPKVVPKASSWAPSMN
jgi:sulfatase maturation enzyme AslB (radical SAM superfamily)